MQNLKIDDHSLKVESKEKDCTTKDVNNIISIFRVFHIYTQISVVLPTRNIQFQLRFAFVKYIEKLMMCWKTYTCDPVLVYYFDLQQTRN